LSYNFSQLYFLLPQSADVPNIKLNLTQMNWFKAFAFQAKCVLPESAEALNFALFFAELLIWL